MFNQNHGALGVTFILTRIAQAISMIAIIGMTANFVSEMVASSITPPTVLIGTLSVVCVAVLYCTITVILYLDNLLPHLINTIIDCLFLIALVVVAVIIGKPLSYVNCNIAGTLNSNASSANSFIALLSSSVSSGAGKIAYTDWIKTSKSTCYEWKSIWGLSIALCILFFLSAVSTLCLWKQSSSAKADKSEA